LVTFLSYIFVVDIELFFDEEGESTYPCDTPTEAISPDLLRATFPTHDETPNLRTKPPRVR
jgi:hypothetical protein